MPTNERKGGRGFAGMDPERQREISRKGGSASHGAKSSAKSNMNNAGAKKNAK